MPWEKKGLIFQPEAKHAWLQSHASLPFAWPIQQNLHSIYFSSRDKQGRSYTGRFEMDLAQPESKPTLQLEPILQPGKIGAFDDSGAICSWLVEHNDLIYMYYVGWNLSVTVPFRNAIGLAVSSDQGRSFQKYAEGPILDRDLHDPYFTASCCVRIENELWRMWYVSGMAWEKSGENYVHRYAIKYAESKDGIEWRRHSHICIPHKNKNEYAIARPCVIYGDDRYKMWYSHRGESYRIGYAESPDGIHWERMDDCAGIGVSESGWDSEMIEYGHVFQHGKNLYMLHNGNGYGRSGIGLAKWIAPEKDG